ncbi:hypothetical protein TNCV_1294381 [Trichonephila clavipes]|nr:hypothetical protein TNCV_1294381 [Trichonephila clavipes]
MADCPSMGRQLFVSVLNYSSRVARGSFLICCCVNVVTSVPVGVPSFLLRVSETEKRKTKTGAICTEQIAEQAAPKGGRSTKAAQQSGGKEERSSARKG